jgi:hypothetical protein
MRRVLLFVLLVAALATLAASAGAASARAAAFGCVHVTQLSPANEIRPADTTDPVTSTARGVSVVIVHGDGTIQWHTVILNFARETFFAGHIHVGASTVAGPVVQPLFEGSASGIVVQNSGSVSNPTLAAAICANPANYYVNYHTTADPQGAVRGQLG